jgi:hypothetical protein
MTDGENNMRFRNTSRPLKELTISVDDFSGGYNNLIDEARLPSKFAVESNNMMQVQDSIWKTRWGTGYYGADYSVSPDGASEYVKTDGTTELIVIAGGKAYSSTDGGSITEITGASFTAGVKCAFLQISGWDNTSKTYKYYLYIANGTDPLTRYNGTTLETYTEISAPTSLTASLVASGLTSGTYTYYAQVTSLNSIGETTGCTEASVTVNKLRDSWTAATDKVTWSWVAASGVSQYQLYLSDVSGQELLLTNVPSTQTSFTDDGTIAINPYVDTPTANTTSAPKFVSMCVSNNRVWATNDTNNKYQVYFSGTGKYISSFSDFYGGGYINLERGGRETPMSVKHYQTGQGEGRLTTLCKTPDGKGSVWQIQIISTTVGSDSFSIPSATKVVGSFGTESWAGVVATENNIAYPNRKGWFDLGPEKQYYGILRTNEKSSNIRPYWRSLVGSGIKDICSYFYDAKIFISVPRSTGGNDKMIVFDTERSTWSVDWSLGAKQFLEYTDNGNVTHFLYIPTSGTKLIELSENIANDLGTAFNQSYISPLLPVSKNKTDILNHKHTILTLGRPKGIVNFEVLGVGKDDSFATISTRTVTDFGSNTGIGTDLFGAVYPSDTNSSVKGGSGAWAIYLTASPSTFAQSKTNVAIKKRAKMYSIQYKVSSTSADTNYSILSLQSKGTIIPRRLPSNWTE